MTIKKLIGKPIEPPPQVELSPFIYISLFSEALLFGLKKQINDPTYLEFLRFSIGEMYKLNVFLFIYEKITNSKNIDLLNSILRIFDTKKIGNAKGYEELNIYQEAIMLIYDNQADYIELIKKIPNVNFLSHLIKFYTIFIFFHFQYNDIPAIENVLINLRDKNPYDKLILPKMFLSEFNSFYRSLNVNPQIKMSLVDGYIQASHDFKKLKDSFSMITEYIQGDFNTILMIIINNYETIHQVCVKNKVQLKINDYIKFKEENDFAKIQENLYTLGQNKLSYGYKAIVFNINK